MSTKKTKLEVATMVILITTLIAVAVYNSITYGTYSSPW